MNNDGIFAGRVLMQRETIGLFGRERLAIFPGSGGFPPPIGGGSPRSPPDDLKCNRQADPAAESFRWR